LDAGFASLHAKSGCAPYQRLARFSNCLSLALCRSSLCDSCILIYLFFNLTLCPEYFEILRAVGVGFVMMGLVGFVVKVICALALCCCPRDELSHTLPVVLRAYQKRNRWYSFLSPFVCSSC
jgi:hypothetical protein